ncbi:cation:proton antiporter [Sulfuricurvum sp.]|uniref:cation:proton antiporter n=1 Tax=Sulfuricurvum sp. TaxID=2025608 RepID=UPI002610D251|nr:cation:proton antiporter [Sulfuricurvum sp.]MDD4950249.1 cation:proton antiporter [Sulfuricurvum sp.]
MTNIPLMIVVISGVVLLAPFIAQTFWVPLAVVEILLGCGVGYSGIIEGNTYMPIIAKTGFLFLMFLAGMEVNLKAFLTMQSSLFKRAIGYFIILYSLSALIVWILHLSVVYLVAFPIVSLGMIMALVKELGKEEEWLKLALIIGILGELISIAALTLLSGILEYGFTENFFRAIGTLILFLIGTILIFRGAKILFWWYPNLKKTIVPESDTRDKDVRLSMAFFFTMVGMMIYLGLDMVLGAFIAGMFIANFFEYKTELPHKLSSLGFGFLIPIFFIYVGSTVNLKALFSPSVLLLSLQIVGVIVTLRVISSMIYLSRLRLKNTLLFALGDSMPLTFLLAVATIGKDANAISSTEYYALIISGMIASISMMTIIKTVSYFNGSKTSNHEF